MPHSYEPNCSSCQTSWAVITVNHRQRIVFCSECKRFVAQTRAWYRINFESVCRDCRRELKPTMVYNPDSLADCPLCLKGQVQFIGCGEAFPSELPPKLRVGAIVEATWDHWAIQVPDLPAIPIDHLECSDGKPSSGPRTLRITRVPGPSEGDREFRFTYAESDTD